jgi:hypothetical protein
MAQYEKYPVGATVIVTNGITLKSPADLKGRKVGIPGLYGASLVAIKALLKAGNLTDSDITLTSIGFTATQYALFSSLYALLGKLLASQSGVKFTHAPYKGSAPAVQDLIGGQLDMMFDTSLIVGPHIQSGKLRPIAVTGSQRVPGFPDVPTIAESGQKGFDMVSWQAMFVPANTPQPVVDRLHAEVMKVLALPDVQAKLKVFGMEPSNMTPAQLLAYQKAEVDKWAKVIKAANIKAE